MFSIFKKASSDGRHGPDTNVSPQFRMSLDERKAYRREMLYQSIREAMLGWEALPSVYKFKVMNVDERQHCFIVMIEVTPKFEAKKSGMAIGFSQIEETIRTHAFERHGVVLDGIFWRVNEAQSSFSRAKRTSDTPHPACRAVNTLSQRKIPGDVRNASVRLAPLETTTEVGAANTVNHEPTGSSTA